MTLFSRTFSLSIGGKMVILGGQGQRKERQKLTELNVVTAALAKS